MRLKAASESLNQERDKSKKLSQSLTASEAKANELQKKYDEFKAYSKKLKDERERLRKELGKGPEQEGADKGVAAASEPLSH